MSLAEYYQTCPIPKGKPRDVVKLEKRRAAQQTERRVRRAVNARDHHRCFFPNCRERAFHKHHQIFRSKGGKWETENVVSGCGLHHGWVHRGLIRLVGNPDNPPLEIERTALGRAAKIRIPQRREA